jgi:ketosteroid isomerase-like protein
MNFSAISIRTMCTRLPIVFFAASDPPALPLTPEESEHVPGSTAPIADSLTAAYVSAYEAKDADAYLSLFSPDADYVDYAVQVHAKIGTLRDELFRSFKRQTFRLQIRSFFVSADGRFAALQGTYTDIARSGDPVSVPIVSVLEFRDRKIAKEILYYDGSPFKRHLHAA